MGPGDTPGPASPLPGGIGLSHLRVYESAGPDGLRGGSPHVHLACTEAYAVLGGEGSVQTLGMDGFAETPLRAGSLVWFGPGLVHRLINTGDLEIQVIMQVAQLPEAGDCLLTFPDAVLADPDAYRAAAAHAPDGSVAAADEEAARRRRDLAVEGFLELRAAMERDGADALRRFHARARDLAAAGLAGWTSAWETGPFAAAVAAGEAIRALRAGSHGHLERAQLHALAPPQEERLGVCGRLGMYPVAAAGTGT